MQHLQSTLLTLDETAFLSFRIRKVSLNPDIWSKLRDILQRSIKPARYVSLKTSYRDT